MVRRAADCLCEQLTGQITGQRPTDRWFRNLDELGDAVADGEFTSIAGITPHGILMPYEA